MAPYFSTIKKIFNSSSRYANYEFLMVDIGEVGGQSDACVFANCNLDHSITRNLLPVPEPNILSGTTSKFPCVFVADDAFPLRLNIFLVVQIQNGLLGDFFSNFILLYSSPHYLFHLPFTLLPSLSISV